MNAVASTGRIRAVRVRDRQGNVNWRLLLWLVSYLWAQWPRNVWNGSSWKNERRISFSDIWTAKQLYYKNVECVCLFSDNLLCQKKSRLAWCANCTRYISWTSLIWMEMLMKAISCWLSRRSRAGFSSDVIVGLNLYVKFRVAASDS